MPSCCKFRYYCSLNMDDPNHILLHQKTTSPSYALTKYESSIHASATGRTSIRKKKPKKLTDLSHCSQCKEFFPLVLVPLSLQQHEKQCLRFYAKSKFISQKSLHHHIPANGVFFVLGKSVTRYILEADAQSNTHTRVRYQ